MRRASWLVLCITILVITISCNKNNDVSNFSRKQIPLTEWKFQMSDLVGADSAHYDDASWQTVTIPNDWSVRHSYSQENQNTWNNGGLIAGTAWYRANFWLTSQSKNKQIDLVFEGISASSKIFLNGHLLATTVNGNVPLRYNILPYIHSGNNIIAVRLDHNQKRVDGIFDGSGINRMAWVEIHSKQYFIADHLKVVTTKISKNDAQLLINYSISNEDSTAQDQFVAKFQILDREDNLVAETKKTITQNALSTQSGIVNMNIAHPKLWSTDSAYQYTLVSSLSKGNMIQDVLRTKIGVRTIQHSSGTTLLNGKPLITKGVRMYHSAGTFGTAVPRVIELYRLKQLKNLGYNSIQTLDYVFPNQFYSLCDSLGFIVFSEPLSSGYGSHPAVDSIDRRTISNSYANHPSIAMWTHQKSVFTTLAYDYLSSANWPLRMDTAGIINIAFVPKETIQKDSLKMRPAQLKLELINPQSITSNGIIFVRVGVADKTNQWIPNTNYNISYTIDSKSKIRIIGVENSDPMDHAAYTDHRRHLYMGQTVLMIQLPTSIVKDGSNSITAVTEGIIEGHLKIY